MKKQHYIYGLFAAALALGACDYNEDNFPGFDELAHPQHVWSDTITLAASDYKTIAELTANQELALSKDPEGESFKAALEAVSSNKFFTEDAPAVWYLPAFIAQKYPYMDNKSKVTVCYNEFASLPAYVTKLAAAKDYKLDSDDYKVVWGEGKSVSFISPSSLNRIPEALNEGISNPKDGEVRVVSYAWSDTEPSFGGGGTDEPEVKYTPIADMLSAGAGDYNVKGQVIATYSRGFLLGDETGSVLVYLNNPANYSVGDVVTVSGTTTIYSGLMQFPNTSTVAFVERSKKFVYPDAVVMNGTDLEAYAAKPEVKYVSVTGKLVISGNYYNLEIDGCSKQGSVSYPVNGLIDPALDGQSVTVTGYLIGATNRFINFMATAVVAAGTSSEFTPVGVVALAANGEYKVKGSVVALYKKGFLLNDGTGSILVYKATDNKIGDVVTVSGTTSAFAGFQQYGGAAVVETVSVAAEDFTYKYPAVRVMEAADMDAYLTNSFVGYVQYTGKLKIDGNYMNVIIDGAEKAQGSLSSVLDGQVDASLDGKDIVVTGYAIGVSGGRFVNTMVLKVEDASAAASAFAMTRAAVKPNTSALYTYNATSKKWVVFSEEDVKVSVFQPADYDQVGYDYVSKPAVTLPIYLSSMYPYAKVDDVAAVVYCNDKDGGLGATECKFDGTTWVLTSEASPATMTFQKAEGSWVEAKVYLESTLLDGQDGGFKAEDVVPLPSGNVWKLENSYGWKGSGYVNGGNLKAESYLVSSELDLTKAAAPTIVFDCAINFLTGNKREDFFNLVVSTDYEGDAASATWKNVEVNGWPEGTSWSFVTVEPASLADYVGQKVCIAFHYKSTTSAAPTVEIKNLSVKE